ncbi:thiamine pyrophosphate-binding protein [Micromonospora sp. KC207]|uniref:thiamine pyrophosphate-binding protein n=1 Tax=Micromonospora sp. KC207 TaxID=2530377 RepID=UPI001FB7C87A|nr:thiamine pyrophosphate-binding protein [Micromonospora sp. KC207]
MAERTVADLVVERLRAWRVPRAFGCPGAAIDPVVAALNRAGGDPEFVPARHGETAFFMASGHAKFTGEIGVCLATQGPSAVHLLNGLYDAKLDSKALRTAAATRSPTCVVLPREVQVAPVPALVPQFAGVMSATPGEPLAQVLPHDTDLAAAASLLGMGNRVAILVGTCRWSATPPRRCGPCWPACRTGPGGRGARRWRRRWTGGGRRRPAPPNPPSRSTRSSCCTNSPPGCPARRRSPSTSARSSTGTPGTWSCRPA